MQVVHYLKDGVTCAQRSYDLLRGRRARLTSTDAAKVTCKLCLQRFALAAQSGPTEQPPATPPRRSVALTASQRSMVAWAADAMTDYWADHESRGEAEKTNVIDPVRMTADGCEVVCRADVLDDLRYRLTEQLPDMEGNVTAGKGGFHAQCAAAQRAYDKIARVCGGAARA